MEYYRTEDGQIQADFARRLGLALRQYRKQSEESAQDYFDTLSLSVLQSLLVRCMHLTKDLASSSRIRSFLSECMGDVLPASTEPIVFQKAIPHKPKKFIDFLKILRDSMSHPNPIVDSSKHVPTGFTSIRDGSGVLNRFKFVWAPSIHSRGWLMGYKSEKEASQLVSDCLEDGDMDPDRLVVEKDQDYWYVRDCKLDERISREVIVELSSGQLYSLAIALSTLLAQPLNKNWDQQTIVPLEYVA